MVAWECNQIIHTFDLIIHLIAQILQILHVNYGNRTPVYETLNHCNQIVCDLRVYIVVFDTWESWKCVT